MNLQLTDRDKVLALVLPAILIVAVYAWWLGWPKFSELSKARTTLESAESQVPGTNAKLMQTRAHLVTLNREVQTLEGVQKKAREAWLAATGMCPEQLRRNARIEQLTVLLKRRNLRLLEDGEADAARDSKITPTLQFLASQMSEAAGSRRPQLRRIRLAGRYLDLVAALDDLAGSTEVLAIPVSVALKEVKPGTAAREWTLIVWI